MRSSIANMINFCRHDETVSEVKDVQQILNQYYIIAADTNFKSTCIPLEVLLTAL